MRWMKEDSDGGIGAINIIVEPAGLCPVQIHQCVSGLLLLLPLGKAQCEVAWQITATLLLSKAWDVHCTCQMLHDLKSEATT